MIISVSTKNDTNKIAVKIADQLKETGGVIALSGELGAGKTTFVQMLAKALEIKEKIISPTFVLIRQHQIPQTENFLYHLDVYRLEDNQDPSTLGLSDFMTGKNITVIEWAEKIKQYLPENTIWIKIKVENKKRIFEIL